MKGIEEPSKVGTIQARCVSREAKEKEKDWKR